MSGFYFVFQYYYPLMTLAVILIHVSQAAILVSRYFSAFKEMILFVSRKDRNKLYKREVF